MSLFSRNRHILKNTDISAKRVNQFEFAERGLLIKAVHLLYKFRKLFRKIYVKSSELEKEITIMKEISEKVVYLIQKICPNNSSSIIPLNLHQP